MLEVIGVIGDIHAEHIFLEQALAFLQQRSEVTLVVEI
jgi:hypothetical protein